MIQGRTFENQKVSAKAHGALFAGMLTDGILRGCSIAYTGSNVTVQTGHFIVGGREIEISATETIGVSGSSGYARIKAVVDTTKTSTESTFTQFSWVVDYSSTLNGFTALTQNDINGNGAKYEAEFCIVALGGSGVTAITRTIGSAKPNGVDYLSKVYPVGSIYMSTWNVSPASFLGGYWESISGAFLYAADSNHPDGTTGGEATHALTVEELPKDIGNFRIAMWNGDKYSVVSVPTNEGKAFQASDVDDNGYSVNYSTGSKKTRKVNLSGGGQAMNNMPPYLSVFMWKRTA